MSSVVTSDQRQYYPALRGFFGDWVFYSCLMSMKDVVARVSYAAAIHNSGKLSEMIQRELKGPRSLDIAEYLVREQQRFFNSLVVAIYGGDPAWHGFSHFKSQVADIALADVPSEAEDSVGFISFTGKEAIFAIDGQHRYAGMKEALGRDARLGDEDVSLVLVAHQKTPSGLERTRRLFTTLNKTAVPVGKGEIIALDENDVMAIVTRHLVENSARFSENRIKFAQTENLAKEAPELTTIGNLYDILKVIFRSRLGLSENAAQLPGSRPTDAVLKKYIAVAEQCFDELASAFTPLGDYFGSDETAAPAIVRKHRRGDGGHVLFRPIGLRMVVEVVVAMVKGGKSRREAFAGVGRLPVELAEDPYRGVIWLANGRVNTAGRVVCRRLLLHMLGLERKPEELHKKYAKMLGQEGGQVELPSMAK